MSPDSPEMLKARDFIRQRGGTAKVLVFTRIYFAQFGLYPWDAVPQLPAEFIFLPSAFFVNVYQLSSWARLTMIPLLVIRHHEPTYALPNGLCMENNHVDELWLDPGNKHVPYVSVPSSTRGDTLLAALFNAIDSTLCWLGGLKKQPLRPYALRHCIKWILEHQEPEGDWAGYCPPMHFGIIALTLEGYRMDDDKVQRGLEALERFTIKDKVGKRMQACVSPVWDTVLMARGLCDAGLDPALPCMQRAIGWIKSQQQLGFQGDWRVNNPKLGPGGFCFQYNNALYPDVDDTAAAILALICHDPEAVKSIVVTRAAVWICGMQNSDGGWGAFERNNDKLWLNKIPFSDMDALCDPSSADVTGRIIEAFGLMLKLYRKKPIEVLLSERISTACDAAVNYLANTQEPMRAWYGRWGCNYVYGTSNVLCGLQYFVDGNKQVQDMMAYATSWLAQVQNTDGGWGEVLESYRHISLAGRGPSTPSQTAWGLMGLLTTCRPCDKAVTSAVLHLTRSQVTYAEVGGSWKETRYTATGFPNFFYLGYELYCHYFPLMALGRYIEASRY